MTTATASAESPFSAIISAILPDAGFSRMQLSCSDVGRESLGGFAPLAQATQQTASLDVSGGANVMETGAMPVLHGLEQAEITSPKIVGMPIGPRGGSPFSIGYMA